ncbi:MAG: hypothetical protein CMK72_02665 [Pseudomonadaceae bacterium]|uniref:3-isopropylmalate dehydratase n=1 Tax=Pseudomonas marincola TaxID=437900 RepID=A0A1I6YWQ2_9PSED|nr:MULTISPECIES: hypothetical protein [Pseudomonas]MBQ53790.1 hypothetical protein [Pseudomonadaceae bacterium]NRH28724.1 hypothetical protein [Pseudomonas sp. MS19]OEO26897.1 hypothetical protein AX279_08880 [Pseudomonas sp. J237]CAE6937974.1 conserved exported protein of unknown function [Pseudomonas marincola]SFT54943.1 hypothetical protein SAMN05216264_101893 [Pseudomonas marincola]
MRLAWLLALTTAFAATMTQAQTLHSSQAQAGGFAILVVSRERLQVNTQCEIGVYLHDQLAGRLFQGQSISFNLPPGEIAVRLQPVGSGECKSGVDLRDSQRLQLRAGDIQRYNIAVSNGGLHLLHANR